MNPFPLFLPIPLFPTSLEEGFSPPPPSSLGSGTEVSRALVVTYIRLFRDPGHHHFFIIFSTPFYIDFISILSQFGPKSFPNPLKFHPRSDLENIQLVSSIFDRMLMDFGLVATSFLSFSFEREAKFQDFDCLLSSCIFINFRLHFWIHFGIIFRFKSI